MLYKSNKSEKLNMELFKNPSKEYRGAPFWSWNSKLNKDMLSEQIKCFKEMGFGGFYMHPRGGMETTYLSEEYIDCIRHCIETAKKSGMLACLYDEDRWPSGFAGGLVTQTPKYRQRALYITKDISKLPGLERDKNIAVEEGKAYLVGCYDIEFDKKGYLKSYRQIDINENAEFNKYYAYSKTDEPSGKYNFQTYTDIMQKEAVEKFISLTHNRFHESFGEEYGNTVPTIFSDEPRHRPLEQMEETTESEGVYYWTYDFEESFEKEYGYDIIKSLPKLVWDVEGTHSYERYDFFSHISERTKEAFFAQINEIAKKQGLLYCGHLMLENELYGQLRWGGDIMRYYPYFDIPGIDILFDNIEFISAKQVQSVVHQYDKEAMLSELYGVTGWDFDFKSLKMQGDWQCALGVSVRVPHLSMYSMSGGAKRDYPASFNYQAPWHKEFNYLETHFARLNTVLSRGKAVVDVAVLHPVETVMLTFTTKEKSEQYINNLENNFQSLISGLLYSNIDFDFINEANLSTQYVECGNKLSVGAMKYGLVIIPPVKTMRSNTAKILDEFLDKGGRVIFTGKCPEYLDGRKNDKIKSLYQKAFTAKFGSEEFKALIEEFRHVKISYADSEKNSRIIYRLNEDNGVKWLFMARAEKTGKTSDTKRNVISEKLEINIKGKYGVQIYNTLTGDILPAQYYFKSGNTTVIYDWYANDSLLLKLTNDIKEARKKNQEEKPYKTIYPQKAVYKRHEENCAVLDMGRYSCDEISYSDRKYFFKLNSEICKKLNITPTEAQPYIIENPVIHWVYIRYELFCEDELENLSIALENAEESQIHFNGREVKTDKYAFYVDESIKTVKLPVSQKGKNIIDIKAPFSVLKQIEPCYLLGDFNAEIKNNEIYLKKLRSDKIEFKSIGIQGMPFYGGNISYKLKIHTEKCRAKIKAEHFNAPCIRVFTDGKDSGLIAFSPFSLEVELEEGEHEIEFLCYGNRNNTFGPIHNTKIADSNYYIMPAAWDYKNEFFTEKYCFQETGILKNPEIELYKTYESGGSKTK